MDKHANTLANYSASDAFGYFVMTKSKMHGVSTEYVERIAFTVRSRVSYISVGFS
jgi:hypothetical protein